MYQHIKVPAEGQKITVNADMSLNVPDQPVIPYIEGDGTGFDITPVMLKVVDAAIANGKVNPTEITHVLPLGGSSRLVSFQEMLKRKFGPDRIYGGNVSPDLAIAEGAAIHAAKLVFTSGATSAQL